MKSSTLRRSTLSKENMEVIEALAKENENNGTIGEYLRPDEVETSSKEEVNKAQEIDLLWQNFKATQFNTNSPSAYILIGFIIGVITTMLIVLGINTYTKKSLNIKPIVDTEIQTTIDETTEQQPQEAQVVEENNENINEEKQEETTASDKQTNEKTQQDKTVSKPVKTKKYIVKNGDTGESIIKHFYGAYTPERADAIIKLNNLKTLDRINIDQELLIPIEQ